MYNVKSLKAEEFISDEEIKETLEYAEANKNNIGLIDAIIEKAKLKKGLTHREASVLLACEIPEKLDEVYKLAQQIKKDFYGNRIVLFAPLYLSNYCVNGCVYCPYHMKNKHIARKKLTQEEIVKEVTALQDMGHKRLAIEAGEDPVNNPIEYILECINTIYSIKHKNGAIRRVNVNIAATTVENYRKLKEAGIGTYILFQETYHKESYEQLHPTGPKHDYAYHTEAMDRAMEGGIDDVGLGVLFGLDKYKYEFAGLLMHAEHLEAVHGVEKELKGFEKVQLAPGETKTVTMELDKRSFAWYNTELHDWYAASGKYEILIGASSRDISLSETIELSSSQVIPMHIHMNTTLGELFNNPDTKEAAKELTSRYLAAMNGGSDTASESAAEAITEEMVAAMTYSMPLRSLCSFGGFSRAEIQEMIDKLQAIYSNPLK